MTASSELTYGGVFLAVLGNQLCLPIPSIAFLMAAGALSAHGKMSTAILIFLSLLGCLSGDSLWFCFGRRWGSKVTRLLCRFSFQPRACSRDVHEKFRRYGLPILFVAKFLPGVDAVLPPLVGAEGASLPNFLAFDVGGSALWSTFYVGLGYLFSNELEVAIRWVQHFATAFGLGIGVPIAIYAGWRGLVLLRMIRQLRLRRISPAMLARKLKCDKKVAVLDMSDFEEETGANASAIPGAFRVDRSLVWRSPHITVPDDIQIVVYSSSGRDVVSARAAVALKRIGVEKVWVLEGGLQAWREQGHPVAQFLEPPGVVAARFGVKLPPPRTGRGLAKIPMVNKIGA